MTGLIPFSFDGRPLRAQLDDFGEPWFCAADVCAALDIDNVAQAVARLDDDERGIISNDTPSGTQEMAFVNEPGLYALVLGSRKPEARRFKRWITHEVLPSIRKTGSYQAPAIAAKQLAARTKEIAQTCVLITREVLGKMMGVPKDVQAATTLEMIRVNTGLEVEPARRGLPATTKLMAGMNPTALGERLGVSARETNRMLADLGFQSRNDRGDWELTEIGKQYGEALVFNRNGHSGYQILWKDSVEGVLRAAESDDAGGEA